MATSSTTAAAELVALVVEDAVVVVVDVVAVAVVAVAVVEVAVVVVVVTVAVVGSRSAPLNFVLAVFGFDMSIFRTLKGLESINLFIFKLSKKHTAKKKHTSRQNLSE